MDSQREASRKAYLEKREQKKLLELEQEIGTLQQNPQSLSYRQLAALEQKQKLLHLAKERALLEQQQEATSFYTIPSALMHSEQDQPDKRQRSLDWEQTKIKQSLFHPESGTNEEYEFVFDPNAQQSSLCGMLEGENEQEALEQITQTRQELPIHQYKQSLMTCIKENRVIVLVGETGSGKTTQLTQYLHEDGYSAQGMIGCTQPRRVAAMSVAKRVSEEMNVALGQEVGYAIRFEDVTSPKTKIKYMTDGVLLREFLGEPDLESYSVLIVDEAHERSLHTDILLGLLKDISRFEGSNLKIIISSATMDAEKFSEFFDDAPIFRVPGRRFPVDIYYTKVAEPDYLSAVVSTILQIHLSQPEGDILVFLTGQEEIDQMQERISQCTFTAKNVPKLLVLPIYSSLPPEMQAAIFEQTPEGTRKVVLATNIAETSITIPGIAFVIDPGFAKVKFYDSRSGMETLAVQPCSKASANQRAGRAGRIGPGKCFRLYTKWSFNHELPEANTPEIQRTNLGNVILTLKAAGVDDLMNFDFLDAPPAEAIIQALNSLFAIGALNIEGALTPMGTKMAEFPLDPMLSKTIVESVKYGCTDQILSITAMLQVQASLFYFPKGKKAQVLKAMRALSNPLGDHLTLCNIWEQWVESGFSSQWCFDFFIQPKAMKRAREVRQQLVQLVERLEICNNTIPSNNSDDQAIRKCICSGFFFNAVKLGIAGDSYRLAKNTSQTVFIHPSSVFFTSSSQKDENITGYKPPKWAIYHELVLTSKEFMRQVTPIEPEWLLAVAPQFFTPQEIERADWRRRK